MSLTIHAFFSAVDMVFLVKFYSWACGFFFQSARGDPASSCGKTDGEAVREDRWRRNSVDEGY